MGEYEDMEAAHACAEHGVTSCNECLGRVPYGSDNSYAESAVKGRTMSNLAALDEALEFEHDIVEGAVAHAAKLDEEIHRLKDERELSSSIAKETRHQMELLTARLALAEAVCERLQRGDYERDPAQALTDLSAWQEGEK
jgi:hypothetical protein